MPETSRFQSLIKGIVPEPKQTPPEDLIQGEVFDPQAENGTTLVQRTSESILQARALMGQLVRGDDESKRLILEYFREGIEQKYLDASIRTDETRLDNLKTQVGLVNEGLSAIVGKDTTIVKIYKDVSDTNPGEYQPITVEGKFNAKGFFDFLRFHRELATKILSASEIASESAEIEAQTALVPLREELNRLTIDEKGKTAEKLSETGEILVKAEIVKGEIRTSKIRGMTTPLITTIAETPIIILQAPVDRLSKWMNEAEDKAIPIAAVGGAVAGPVILFTRIAVSSPIVESWLSQNIVVGTLGGIFGGALVSVAAWETVKNILPTLKGAFDYTVEKLENLKKK